MDLGQIIQAGNLHGDRMEGDELLVETAFVRHLFSPGPMWTVADTDATSIWEGQLAQSGGQLHTIG